MKAAGISVLTCLAGRAGVSAWDWVDIHSEEASAEPKPVIASAGPSFLFLFSANNNPASLFSSLSQQVGRNSEDCISALADPLPPPLLSISDGVCFLLRRPEGELVQGRSPSLDLAASQELQPEGRGALV